MRKVLFPATELITYNSRTALVFQTIHLQFPINLIYRLWWKHEAKQCFSHGKLDTEKVLGQIEINDCGYENTYTPHNIFRCKYLFTYWM